MLAALRPLATPASGALTPYARRFNGTSDFITFGPGSIGTAIAYGTIAVLIRCTNDTSYMAACSVESSTSTLIYELERADNTQLNVATLNTNGSGCQSSNTGPYWTVADGWVLMVVKKTNGNQTPAFWKGTLGGTWTSSAGLASLANTSGTVSKILLGSEGGAGDFWAGDIAMAAVWKDVALSDANIQTLHISKSTWTGLSPTWCVSCDQASTATTITDLTGGGGNQTAITGTSVVSDGPALSGYGS